MIERFVGYKTYVGLQHNGVLSFVVGGAVGGVGEVGSNGGEEGRA